MPSGKVDGLTTVTGPGRCLESVNLSGVSLSDVSGSWMHTLMVPQICPTFAVCRQYTAGVEINMSCYIFQLAHLSGDGAQSVLTFPLPNTYIVT